METNDRFYQLFQINQAAFEEGHFNTAYYSLAAALFCAQDNNDLLNCQLVERTAESQAKWIDLHAPRYEYSSSSAKSRGFHSHGIFLTLSRQAHSASQLIKPPTQEIAF